MEERIYWSDKATDDIIMVGGIYFRSYGLNKFIEKVEKKYGEVLGLRFEDNNVELLIESQNVAGFPDIEVNKDESTEHNE